MYREKTVFFGMKDGFPTSVRLTRVIVARNIKVIRSRNLLYEEPRSFLSPLKANLGNSPMFQLDPGTSIGVLPCPGGINRIIPPPFVLLTL